VHPPSMAELERRLRGRKQNTPEDLARRLKEAAREISESSNYDYQLTNLEFRQAYEELKRMVFAERRILTP